MQPQQLVEEELRLPWKQNADVTQGAYATGLTRRAEAV
jgi:hypothetical protein